ncbi:uncharacterized protein LOC110440962, partial [Mizuhopecten yessoensis]|uniref:uncharacterized protein LOC110440962 n=1 Tax=Mizuhopecten yessoensis TaxID=6573 RepID=UPI000B4599AE
IEPCFLPNDVKLVVEDQHLHVNRDLLASASPDFAAWLKDEWQDHQQADTTLRFTGKTYHDMSIFMKCLLPSFPKQVTNKNLDIVLSLANEYQTADLLRKCVEVINQRVESLSEVSIYIPPSRIVTYLRWIEKFNIDDAKACVVKSASYLEGKKLQKEPGYKDIGYELKLEISYARAELLESLFVVTVEEIM